MNTDLKKNAKKIIKEQNPNRPQIPDHPYRILMIGGSGYGNKFII